MASQMARPQVLRRVVSSVLVAIVMALSVPSIAAEPQRPNIIFILADDVGYGDFSCYGSKATKTPNVEKLAAAGLRFTDGHSPASTCTPTRYAVMTGEYAWRKPGTGILPGDARLIIDPKRTTLPSMLKAAGYTTAAVGKWHLGLGDGDINWNVEVKPGPREIGFDYSFILPATGDRVPCVYMENQRVIGLDENDPITVSYKGKVGSDPTGKENPDLLKMKFSRGHDCTIVNGISRIGYMSGGKSARWVDEDMADTITKKAVAFIEQNKEKPFFLYFATHDIHVPRVPHQRFKETSQCGIRGDAVHQFDWSVGQVMEALDRLNLAENTLVILSSDNGPVIDDGYADGSVQNLGDHKAAGPLRGGKYSIYEGGSRMPFIVRWPARVKPGVSDALVCQIDLLASLASLTGQKLPDDAAPDSHNVLPALLGESKQGREHLVEQAGGLGIRVGPWKLVPGGGGGGKKAGKKAAKDPELYDLSVDIGETKNVADQHADRVKEMEALLQSVREKGRSRP